VPAKLVDECVYTEFLYGSDPDFVEEFSHRDAEARAILETARDVERTILGLDRGKTRIR
jgi:hypothetical protein